MARSLQQQIDDNDAAIARAEVSQGFTIRGRSQQLALLQTLYAERERLRGQASDEALSNVPMCSVGVQVRPS